MWYNCSCGFSANTATAFYRHLAQSKESGGSHQLVQARLSLRKSKDSKKGSPQHAAGSPSPPRDASPARPLTAAVPAAEASGPAYQRPNPLFYGSSSVDPPLPMSLSAASTLPEARSRASDSAPYYSMQAATAPLAASAQEDPWNNVGTWVDEYLVVDRAPPSPQPATSPMVPSSPRTSLRPGASGGVPAAGSPLGLGLGAPKGSGTPVSSGAKGPGAGSGAGHAAGDGIGVEDIDCTVVAGRGSRSRGHASFSSRISTVFAGFSPSSWKLFGGDSPSKRTSQAAPQSPTPLGPHQGPGPSEMDQIDDDGTGAMDLMASLGGPRGLATAGPDYGPGAGGSVTLPAAVVRLEEVVAWRDPWLSARVLAGGLYVLVCVQQMGRGSSLPLQPTTLAFFAAALLLARNAIRNTMAVVRGTEQPGANSPGTSTGGVAAVQQHLQQHLHDLQHHDQQQRVDGAWAAWHEAPPSPSANGMQFKYLEQEAALHERVTAYLHAATSRCVPYAAAAVVLCARVLSGRRPLTAVLVAGLLWLGMLLGELRLVGQLPFLMLCYLALMTVPAAYIRSRRAMDATLEDLLRYVLRVLLHGNRTTLLAAAAATVAVMVWAPLNIVLRATAAASAGFAVLLWHAHAVQQAAASGELSGGGFGPGPRVGSGGGAGRAGYIAHAE